MKDHRALALALALAALAAGANAQEWREETVRHETTHPYPNRHTGTVFTVERPGATQMRLWFERLETERGWDFIDLHDRLGARIQRLTGSKAGFWSDTVQGDRIEVRLTSDDATNAWGALVTRVASFGEAPRRSRIDRIQLLDRGRPIASTDVLTLRAAERIEIDVQAQSRRGDVVEGFEFQPALRTSASTAPVRLERVSATRFRIIAGTAAVQNASIEIYDAQRPELSARFLVSIRAWQPGDPNPIVEILFQIPDGLGGVRTARPGEVVQLTTRGGSNDRVPMRIVAQNPGGHTFDPALMAPLDVTLDVGAEHGTVERTGAGEYLFRAGEQPHGSIHITAADPSNRETRSVLGVATARGHGDGHGWGRSRIDRIQLLDRGREVSPTQVFTLGAEGQPDDHIDFDVRAFNRRGEVLSDFEFQPALRSGVQPIPVSVEKLAGSRIRVHAGPRAAENVVIEIYDQRRTEAAARITVTIRPLRPGNSIAGLEFDIPDGRGGERAADDEEVVYLTTKDGGVPELPFRVAAWNQAGHGFDPTTVSIDVSIGVVGWYGSLEMVGPGRYVFRSGMLAHPGIRITAVDRTNPSMRKVLVIATRRGR